MFDNLYIAKIINYKSMNSNKADTYFTKLLYKKGDKYFDIFNSKLTYVENSINLNNMCKILELKPFINNKKLVKKI